MKTLKNLALILIGSAFLVTLFTAFLAALGIAVAFVIAVLLLFAIASLFGVKNQLAAAIFTAIDA